MKKKLQLACEVVAEVERSVGEDTNIFSISDRVGYSPWYLQKVFKEVYGETLGSYIRSRKLEISKQLLLESDYTILDIAFISGFSSHESFSRAFKKLFKVTPSKFRSSRRA